MARAQAILVAANLDDGLRSPWTGSRGSCAHRTRLAAVTDADRDLDLVSSGKTLLARWAHHVGDDHWRLVLSCPTDRRRSREDVLGEVRAALVRYFGHPDAEEIDGPN